MRAITYSNFRNELKENIRRIREDAEPLLVTNKDPEDNIIVMNQSDYDSLMETLRLYENPAMAQKVMKGLQDVREGHVFAHALLEDE